MTTETTPTLPADQKPTDVTPEPAAAPDWRTLLESVPAEELRKHPRIAGIAGEHAQRLAAAEIERQHRDQEEKTQQAERERLREMARSDPERFATEYLSQDEQVELRERLDNVRRKTREEFAQYIGRAYQTVPEWAEFTAEDHEVLARAVAGKPDDEVIAAYNAKAMDLVAERRADRRLRERWDQGIEKEVEARLREHRARELAETPAPDNKRSSGPSRFDPTRLSDKDFDAWYRKNVLGKL